MFGRAAACAAVLFAWPVCTQLADRDGPLLPSESVIAVDQQAGATPRNAAEAEQPTALPQSVDLAPTPLGAIEANAATASETIRSETEPFGLTAEPVITGEILTKWGVVETQIITDNRVLAHCRNRGSWCPRAARRFLAIVDGGRTRNGRARIGVINREINMSIIPTSDVAQWGVADRWSPPLETFTTLHGDCEDYAIAKYVALRAAGLARQDVRLVVVRNDAAREHHAVVAVRLDGDWVILDNRWLALVRDREMRRATPLFELDDNGVRRFVNPAARIRQASSSSP